MNSSSWLVSSRILGLLSALAAVSACTERNPGDETDSGSSTQGPTSNGPTSSSSTDPLPTTTDPTGGPTPDPTGGPEMFPTVAIGATLAADILFVIDNSATMGVPQAKLAKGMPSFLAAIEELDWRIGITTTDSGNPRCPAQTTTPELGQLVLRSCLDRVAEGEFVVEGVVEDVSFACTDVCARTDAELPIEPTATHLSDGQLAPRRWVESWGGLDNLPDDVDEVEALQCFVPQGVRGCGFESHLESMFRALARANDPGSPTNHGFIRPSASLTVIFVSDETDCSSANGFEEIFTDNKVFWEDPDALAPTSAVCWNAGVTCEGPGPVYPDCFADNHGLGGDAGVSDDAAVLQPLSKYVDFVQVIENDKKAFDPLAEVRVAMIAGVPEGYDKFDAEIVYEDAADQQVQSDFGIGPGCVDALAGGFGVPPVREREFAEAFAVGDTRDIFSVCSDSFAGALADIGELIRAQIRPACMPLCVADTAPGTPAVEPNCAVFEVDLSAETRAEVAPCVVAGDNWTVPDGETVCFAPLGDRDNSTPSAIDDMSVECVAEGFNLEFLFVRTAPPPPGVIFEATCETSKNPTVDCPAL